MSDENSEHVCWWKDICHALVYVHTGCTIGIDWKEGWKGGRADRWKEMEECTQVGQDLSSEHLSIIILDWFDTFVHLPFPSELLCAFNLCHFKERTGQPHAHTYI